MLSILPAVVLIVAMIVLAFVFDRRIRRARRLAERQSRTSLTVGRFDGMLRDLYSAESIRDRAAGMSPHIGIVAPPRPATYVQPFTRERSIIACPRCGYSSTALHQRHICDDGLIATARGLMCVP
jgi:hypothetical protein